MNRPALSRDEVTHIRSSIKELLLGHCRDPFRNIQEADRQAELAIDLRARLDKNGKPRVKFSSSSRLYGLTGTPQTSRVHLESKLHPKKTTRTDIAILRADSATLSRARGPTDIVYRLKLEDVAAAIELKVFPTTLRGEHSKCAGDLDRLWELMCLTEDLQAFFVLIDQALAVDGTTSKKPPDRSWRKHTTLQETLERPEERHIEFWELRSSDARVVPAVSYWR